MPYVTEFIDGGTGVLHVGSGVVTSAEIIEGARRVQSDESRARGLTHGLTDLTDVSELRVTTAELRLIVDASRKTAKLVPRGVVAIVAPKDHAFGMARMWELLIDEDGWTTRVFRDRVEAEIWLREQLSAAGLSDGSR